MGNWKEKLARPVNDESLKRLIIATYQESINALECDQGLKEALKSHERIPLFLLNLQKQFTAIPAHLATKENVIYTVKEMTRVFVANVEKKANEQMMSDAEKTRMIREDEKAKIIDHAADTGIINEEVLDVLREET